jgi:hypothetical protein
MTRINAVSSTSWIVRRYARWHSKLASVFDVEVTTIRQGQRGEANDARKMAMYLVKRLRDLTYKRQWYYFEVGSDGVAGLSCAQVRAK